jgi:hypothetical protein
MSAKIVSSGASGKRGWQGSSGGGGQAALTDSYVGFGSSSNVLTGTDSFTWDNSGKTLSITGIEDHEATIQSGRSLTIKSTGQDMNVSGLIVNITSGSGNIEITSANNLNLSALSGDCTIDISNSVNIYAQNGNMMLEALGSNHNITMVSEGHHFAIQGTDPDNAIYVLFNNVNNVLYSPDGKLLTIQNANGQLSFFDGTGSLKKTVPLNTTMTLSGLQSTLNDLLTSLGTTGYGLIAN